jgi:hypothetical protein
MRIPPVTQDLWEVIRDRINTATMATILKGTNRVYIEGDYVGQPWGEEQAGGRAVVVPVAVVGGTPWEDGSPLPLRFLIRTDFNDVDYPGLHNDPELAQREAARRLSHWNPNTVLASNKVMAASLVRLDAAWQPRILADEASGTVFMSSSWFVDVASTAD